MITRTSRRYLARVNSEPVSAVTGRARRARRPDEKTSSGRWYREDAAQTGARRGEADAGLGRASPWDPSVYRDRGDPRDQSGSWETGRPSTRGGIGPGGSFLPRDGRPSRTGRGANRGRRAMGAARGLAMWHYLQRGVGNAALPTLGPWAAGAAGTPHCGSDGCWREAWLPTLESGAAVAGGALEYR